VTHAVRKVRYNVKICEVGKPEWDSAVVMGTVMLVTRTLPLLSSGWGGGASMICVTSWSLSLSTVALLLDNIATGATCMPACLPAYLLTCFFLSSLSIRFVCLSICRNLSGSFDERSTDKRVQDIVSIASLVGCRPQGWLCGRDGRPGHTVPFGVVVGVPAGRHPLGPRVWCERATAGRETQIQHFPLGPGY
jgi:hypothetical protein